MSPCPFRSIAIVGFGLIGASIAAAVRRRDPAIRLTAIDRQQVVLQGGLERLCDQAVSIEDVPSTVAALKVSQLTVLAAPVAVIGEHLPLAMKHAQLVTDCGSTKGGLVAIAREQTNVERFVPGHPMAGSSSSGFSNADPELFDGKRWLFCDDLGVEATLCRVEGWAQWLGAKPHRLSAEDHDAAVALTSHLPQLLASVLMVQSERRGATSAEGPGFRSATRVAGGNPEVWRDIFASNARHLAAASRELSSELGRIAVSLERGHTEALVELLQAAADIRAGADLAD